MSTLEIRLTKVVLVLCALLLVHWTIAALATP